MQPGDPSGQPFLTIREAMLEIRDEVRKLADHLDRIDRGGSIGTKAELQDHESRLRSLERYRYALPSAAALGGAAALASLLFTWLH